MTQDISKMETIAVEWLQNEFYVRGQIGHEMPDWLKELFEQAKAMEKEQIVNTYKHGQNNGYMYKDVGNVIIDAEQYYNQTYGGKEL